MTEAETNENEVKSSGTFRIRKDNSKILKGIIEALSNITDEAEIRITPKGFIIKAMDSSRICLLKVDIGREHFDEYECDEVVCVPLNLDDFDKILKRSTTNDSLELSLNIGSQKLQIKMKPEDNKRVKTFSLSLIQLEVEEIPMDTLLKINYPSRWRMDFDFLNEALKDAEIYSEILTISTIEGDKIMFSSRGQIGEMSYEIEEHDLIEATFEDTNTGAYSLNFLKAIMKMATITERLTLSLKTDHPFKLSFEILEGGQVDFFVAPRVDDESDPNDDENMDEF